MGMYHPANFCLFIWRDGVWLQFNRHLGVAQITGCTNWIGRADLIMVAPITTDEERLNQAAKASLDSIGGHK